MAGATAIPAFALYGEAGAPGADLLHVEGIQARSSLYRWEIEAHVHQGLHQIVWLRAGPAQIALDTDRRRAEGPAAIVVPPGVVHAFRFSAASDGQVLTLNPRLLVEGDVPAARDALHALFAEPRVLSLAGEPETAARVGALFAELAAEFQAPGVAGGPVPLWLARAVVWRLAQHAARQERSAVEGRGRQHALFTRFVVLVEAHYREHWPVSRYAERLGLTAERLNRLVRAECGQSALELVHERLAREACRRLVYVAAPIARLAHELGFEDPAYFCRFFKRRLGVSPRAYRQQALPG